VKTGAPSLVHFNLEPNFFGFNTIRTADLHVNLYDLLLAGEGCWSWETIYHLPLHIRRLWITKINQRRDAENAQAEELSTQQKNKKHR